MNSRRENEIIQRKHSFKRVVGQMQILGNIDVKGNWEKEVMKKIGKCQNRKYVRP